MAISPMTDPSLTHETAPTPDYDQYRELSMLAVASLVLGLVSITALLFTRLILIPLVGLLCGWRALHVLRERPSEMTGRPLAMIGTCLSAAMLVGSGSLAAYTYLTEVPAGYTRISWLELQPDEQRPDLPVSPASLELDGRKVFVKGYIYPDNTSGQVKRFVLVPDMGTCCFGGQPKLTDMIEVTLQGDRRVSYSYRKQRLGGTLKVDTRKKPVSGLDGVYYQLDADYLK